MYSKIYFVTGIGTGVGKTIISAILCEAMKADYWKPVQAGNLSNTDSMIVRRLVTNKKTIIHPEAYLLSKPISPHAAAAWDGKKIKLSAMGGSASGGKKIRLPQSKNKWLVIEGAGGVFVPLNKKNLVIDLIQPLGAEVILVSQIYLGSINHTLLTAEALKRRKIKIKGIIFNGKKNKQTEDIILHFTKLKFIGRIGDEKNFNRKTILKYSNKFGNQYAVNFF